MHLDVGGCSGRPIKCGLSLLAGVWSPLPWGEVDRTIQAEHNAFLMRDNFDVECTPPPMPIAR